MDGYKLALTLHVLAVMALFIGAGLVVVALGGARRAKTVASLREWAGMGAVVNRLLPLFGLAALAPAIFMVQDRWGWKTQWVNVAFAALIVALALSPALIQPRLGALARAANATADGPVPPALRRLTLDPLLWLGVQVLTTLMTGIVVLMTFKPNGAASALVIVCAALLGLLATAPAFSRFKRFQTDAPSARASA